MTVAELKQRLEDMDNDAEVRLAMQPNWPFEYSIADVVDMADYEDEYEDDEEADDDDDDDDEPKVVYLTEGDQLGYLSGHAARAAGWK